MDLDHGAFDLRDVVEMVQRRVGDDQIEGFIHKRQVSDVGVHH